MTKEQVNSIPFKFSMHMSMEHDHCTSYTAEYEGHKFTMCKKVPFRNGEPRGKGTTRYMVDGNMFRTKQELYDYCLTIHL